MEESGTWTTIRLCGYRQAMWAENCTARGRHDGTNCLDKKEVSSSSVGANERSQVPWSTQAECDKPTTLELKSAKSQVEIAKDTPICKSRDLHLALSFACCLLAHGRASINSGNEKCFVSCFPADENQ